MGLSLGVMSAAVTLDDKDYRRKLAGIEGASESSFKRIGQLAAGYLSARALFGFVSGAMAEFSKLEEGNNKLKYAYTELRAEASLTARELAKTYNLASSTATNAIANVGDMLISLGFSQREALDRARQITERGIDVASFKGLDQTEVIQRMTVALTGETESLKRMGVVVRQGSKDFKNQGDAIMQTTGATESVAKAQVILQEIMRQTQTSAGDYLRPDEPRTYAQEMTDLKEAVKQFKAEIGGQLQPITQETIVKARELLQWYNKLTPAAKSFLNTTLALSAALTVLSKSKIGKGILTAGAGGADVEAQQVKAREEVKRAEAERTDAIYDANNKRQILRLAKEEQAVASVALQKAKEAKIEAQKSGNVAAIAAATKAESEARASLAAASAKVSKAQQEYNAAKERAISANLAYRKSFAGLDTTLSQIASGATIAGQAQLFLANGFRTAAAGVKVFFASLGPVGWAILGLTAAYYAFSAMIDYANGKIEEHQRKLAEEADAAASATQKNEAYIESQLSAMERLEELQNREKLNNAERKIAAKALEDLSIEYDNAGKSVDEMIARNGEETRSLQELIAAKKEELRLSRISALEKEIAANQSAIDANESAKKQKRDAYVEAGRKLDPFMVNGMLVGGLYYDLFKSDDANAELDKNSQQYYDRNFELRKQLARLKNGGAIDEKGGLESELEGLEEISKEVQQLTKKEWEIKFHGLEDASKQAEMLDEEIGKIFSRHDDSFNSIDSFLEAARNGEVSAEAVKDAQRIVELEGQKAQIRRDSKREADTWAREDAENERQRQRRIGQIAVDRQIREAERRGDDTGVSGIIQRELAKARSAAKQMEAEYKSALEEANADKILTEEERRKVDERRRRWQEALSDEEHWDERAYRDKERQESNKQTVGAWSSEVLNALLGNGNKPEEETAKNTKETVRLLREQLNKKESNVYV